MDLNDEEKLKLDWKKKLFDVLEKFPFFSLKEGFTFFIISYLRWKTNSNGRNISSWNFLKLYIVMCLVNLFIKVF